MMRTSESEHECPNPKFTSIVRRMRFNGRHADLIPDVPLVRPGDDLAGLLISACERNALAAVDGDVLVVAQKVVSKAEGRYVDLATVRPSPRANALPPRCTRTRAWSRSFWGVAPCRAPAARRADRRAPARLHHGECRRRPLQRRPRHRSGTGAAAAGDPDASAAILRDRLAGHFGQRLGVIVSDSWGRAWRRGTVGSRSASPGCRP